MRNYKILRVRCTWCSHIRKLLPLGHIYDLQIFHSRPGVLKGGGSLKNMCSSLIAEPKQCTTSYSAYETNQSHTEYSKHLKSNAKKCVITILFLGCKIYPDFSAPPTTEDPSTFMDQFVVEYIRRSLYGSCDIRIYKTYTPCVIKGVE